jgi:antitoxin component of MazEF toxin-antitoxin module
MLKKLSKYGNSTTLVIDRAILELLNMDESSMVKLQTDGKSLIITPVAAGQKEKSVSYGPEEGVRVAMQTWFEKEREKSTVSQADVEKIMPQMQEDYKKVFDKHKDLTAQMKLKFGSKEFQEALAEITQRFDPETEYSDYIKELEKLKIQFVPEITELNKDLLAIGEKYKNI